MINWIRSVRVWFPKSLLFGNVGAQGLEEKWPNPCQGKSFPSMLIKYLTPNSSAERRKSCPVLCQHHLVTQNLKKPRKPLILWDLLVDVFFFSPFLFIWNISQHSFRDIWFSHFPAFLWCLHKVSLSVLALQSCPVSFLKCSYPSEAETEIISGMRMWVSTALLLFLHEKNIFYIYMQYKFKKI